MGPAPPSTDRCSSSSSTATALTPFIEPVHLTDSALGSIPRTYIECTLDEVIDIDLQRAMVAAAPCRHVFTLEASHSPFISTPAKLADILSTLANSYRTPYNDDHVSYNESTAMTTTYVMKVSTNGQVSIPAEARTRWLVDQVLVVDLGDRVVIRPLPAQPVAELTGKYRDRGPSTKAARATQRTEAARLSTRKR
jgi:bifunctional DNA-binding transcriptional regulator/antitoxin component of YhaV-PrlF toxin-antitoxin module